jgi:hypothetical protein
MKLREYARGQDCQIRLPGICNGNPETTVLAHFRMAGISGMGIKSPDVLGAHACSDCHGYVDTHHDIETRLSFLEGVIRTISLLISRRILKW